MKEMSRVKYFGIGLLAFGVWFALYSVLLPMASWLTYEVLGFEPNSGFGMSLEFFLYDTVKILMLLVLMVYLIGWLRAGLNTEKVRTYLTGKAKGIGYVLGAGFGAITPFCSCSSIPLFIGFTTARIPLGITMSFLITSPLINEVAVILLWGLLGVKFTVLYVFLGILAGVLGGIFIDAIKAEKYLQSFLLEQKPSPKPGMLLMNYTPKITLAYRHDFALSEVKNIFKKVWKWVIVGVGIGAFMHGFIPQNWFSENMGHGEWWSVPLSVIVGIPLYTNVTGIIPIMESLLIKGLPLGTTLAFCMSAVGASLPEILMLKQVMQTKLLGIFIGMLLAVFTLYGWIFNALQMYLV